MGLLLNPIAHIRTDLPEKFGVPRQSNLAKDLKGRIVFEKAYRNPEAVRGLSEFSYIWLIWEFQEVKNSEGVFKATVRPPRLGGNDRMGVFATRSPFRPNPLGLSSVKLLRVEMSKEMGPILHVSGVDLRDNTPIFDIKPYLGFADSHPEATGGFTDTVCYDTLRVEISPKWEDLIPPEKRSALIQILEQDPRCAYQNDPERVYGMNYAGLNIRFTVSNEKVLKVVDVK